MEYIFGPINQCINKAADLTVTELQNSFGCPILLRTMKIIPLYYAFNA